MQFKLLPLLFLVLSTAPAAAGRDSLSPIALTPNALQGGAMMGGNFESPPARGQVHSLGTISSSDLPEINVPATTATTAPNNFTFVPPASTAAYIPTPNQPHSEQQDYGFVPGPMESFGRKLDNLFGNQRVRAGPPPLQDGQSFSGDVGMPQQPGMYHLIATTQGELSNIWQMHVGREAPVQRLQPGQIAIFATLGPKSFRGYAVEITQTGTGQVVIKELRPSSRTAIIRAESSPWAIKIIRANQVPNVVFSAGYNQTALR